MSIHPEGSRPTDESTREARAALSDTPDYNPNLRWWAFTGDLYDVDELGMSDIYPDGYVLTCETCAFRLDQDRRPSYKMRAGENASIHRQVTGEDAATPREDDFTVLLLEYEGTLYRLSPGSEVELMDAIKRNGHPDSEDAYFLLDDAHLIKPQHTTSYAADATYIDALVPDDRVGPNFEKKVVVTREKPFGRYVFDKCEVRQYLSDDDRVSYLKPVGDF